MAWQDEVSAVSLSTMLLPFPPLPIKTLKFNNGQYEKSFSFAVVCQRLH
jgi:hypothetical protein